MKAGWKITLIIWLMMGTVPLYAQTGHGVDSLGKKLLAKVVDNPDLLNDAFAKFRGALLDTNRYDFMRKLDLSFKTFQTGASSPALGFEYQYDNSWTQRGEHDDFTQTFSLNFDGNVAFKKEYNPNNLLESKFNWNLSWFWGGKGKKNNPEEVKELVKVSRAIEKALDKNDEAALGPLRERRKQLTSLSNQFYIGGNGTFAYETNQDFSKQQLAPGLLLNIGVKPWDRHGALRWFNLPDYPFALLRLITGTDNELNISRASFPSVLAGIDHVIPQQDSLRKAVTGKLEAFNRFHFEAAFKTAAAAIGKQVIWFSADYRWYRELAASEAIRNAKLDHFNYFTCNLSSSNGFFISYTTGRLPFDIKNTNVYGMGFTYNLGNWQ